MSMIKEMTNQEIADALADPARRERVFTDIMNTYQRQIYWHIRRLVVRHDDADDILQNTFIKAWTSSASYRGDASITTWLYRIATNESIDFLNSAHQRYSSVLSEMDDYLVNSFTGDPWFDGDAAEQKLQEAILTLPRKQRIVFNLRYYDEMPYNEMSKVLDTTEGALKASYHHAAKKVEDFLRQSVKLS
ncbi:MAG: RNA polymerase sigma factor [Paludibacteraceae bacterium]|nr:RNA polymerase sigma factor [Paludibacteraceae bacterium]